VKQDKELLADAVEAARVAGDAVLEQFSRDARPRDLDAIWSALRANDAISMGTLRTALEKARPEAGWVEDELDTGALPDGEWWVADPVEGNINAVHGMDGWAVTATLIRDNEPVLTVVYVPLTGDVYTAVAGEGAFQNGSRLTVSGKTGMGAAYVGTGQAQPGEDAETIRLLGTSLSAMLGQGFIARVSVPATMQLVEVAAGRMDAFWQFSAVRSGLAAGALLVTEAGGVVTDVQGRPWTLESRDFLAAAPGVHADASTVLAGVR
jgi:myo-inositol-1(or 4)-monophosphatase